MKWILIFCGLYGAYFLVVALLDYLSEGAATTDDEDTQIIAVDYMLKSKWFVPQSMILSDNMRQEYMDQNKMVVNNRPQRVTGAVFAQGYEVNSYNAQMVKNGQSVFDGGVIRS